MANMSKSKDQSYIKYLFSNLNYDLDMPVSLLHKVRFSDSMGLTALLLYIDPDHPERNFSSRQLKKMVSHMVAGLKYFGLQKGDAVCVMALNDVSGARSLHRYTMQADYSTDLLYPSLPGYNGRWSYLQWHQSRPQSS